METRNSFFIYSSPFDLIQRIFTIYWSRLLLFTQLALIVTIPQILLAVTMRRAPVVDQSEMIYEGAEEVPQNTTPQELVVLGIEIVLSNLITIFIQAAIIHVVSEIYMHRHATLKRSLAVACDRFCAIFGFGFLYSAVFFAFFTVVGIPVVLLFANKDYFLAALIGVAAFAIAAYVIISLMIVLPVLVVENQSPIGAVTRPFELVPGYRCYIFCSLFLLNVMVFVVTIIYQGIIGKVFGASIVATILNCLSSIVTMPLQTIMVTALYFSVRIQKEGMNVETLMKEFEVDTDGTENYKQVIACGETV